MECGAGKHWTEEEVKALLTVWSERNIQRYLHGATRNKAMFIYISSRLQDFGVFRDWKQCRAKYKNLKYEYRTVKHAHSSGDLGKSMKFFLELDAILAGEAASQAPDEEEEEEEEEDGARANSARVSEEETRSSSDVAHEEVGEICVALEEDDLSMTSDDLLPRPAVKASSGAPGPGSRPPRGVAFIPPVATEGGKHWTDDEVRALLYVWSDRRVQAQLEGAARNRSIFQEIARRLQRFGIERDWKQCRTKYKNLKYEYKTARSSQGSGRAWKNMKFFKEVESILENRPLEQLGQTQDRGMDFSEEEDSPRLDETDTFSTNSEEPVIPCIKKEPQDADEDAVSCTSEDHTILSTWKRLMKDADDRPPPDRALNQFRVITVNDSGIGRNWSDDEVRALILVWSDEGIRQQLEGATRNKDIFLQISRRLLRAGVDRDWKQCRTKYKNLKYVYRALQRGRGPRGDPRRVMRFYDEVDAILRRAGGPGAAGREEVAGAPSRPGSGADNSPDEEEPGAQAESLPTKGIKRKAKEELPLSPRKCPSRRDTAPPDPRPRCKEERAETGTPTIQIGSVCSIAPSPRSAPAKVCGRVCAPWAPLLSRTPSLPPR
nr:PREDICTED: trihelix transcription factor GT-2 [Lepisosteus oculatus]